MLVVDTAHGHSQRVLDRISWIKQKYPAIPVIGGPSLSVSYMGMFLVFTYMWLPYMILPTQAALERVPSSPIKPPSSGPMTKPMPNPAPSRPKFCARSPGELISAI